MWLVIIFAENLNAGFRYLQQQEQTEFVKVFLYCGMNVQIRKIEDKGLILT